MLSSHTLSVLLFLALVDYILFFCSRNPVPHFNELDTVHQKSTPEIFQFRTCWQAVLGYVFGKHAFIGDRECYLVLSCPLSVTHSLRGEWTATRLGNFIQKSVQLMHFAPELNSSIVAVSNLHIFMAGFSTSMNSLFSTVFALHIAHCITRNWSVQIWLTILLTYLR